MTFINNKVRITAFLLLFITIFVSIPSPVLALPLDILDSMGEISDDVAKVTVLHNGAEKSSIVIEEHSKETLTYFVAGSQPTESTWQIRIPNTDSWVNINGYNTDTLPVGYALIDSMLDANGAAYIRASVTVDGKTYNSEPVAVSVAFHAYNGQEEAEETVVSMNSSRPNYQGEEPDLGTYTIVINYIFDNGGIAFEPFGASVASGSDFYREVTSPTVVGYDPYRRIDESYVAADKVVIDVKNISSNITVNVIYQPAIVDFEVHHHLQDIYDDTYSAHPDFITESKGLTGSTVGDGLAMTELELPGFKALAYEKLTIAADGSTVVEIRYDRNYYLVRFDMQGGFGVEPVYARYGTLVGANAPTRPGYVFEGWELVSYGGRTPTAQEVSMYDINNGKTINIPNASLDYRAVWSTQLTEYTMVFWKENIEDNKFTYWGHLDGLTAMSGSYVSGADRIGELSGIDDENCFTYNPALTDTNVLVEGDGSTVVNVYYTRNRYSITFKAKGLCTITENHTHTDACYTVLCSGSHEHTDDCVAKLHCLISEHTAHTASCIDCGKTEHTHSAACCGLTEHTHNTSCFPNVGDVATPNGATANATDGYIYVVRSGWRYNYYISIAGVWYSYSGSNVSGGDIVSPNCGKTNHTHGTAGCSCNTAVHVHTDTCYKDVIHTHDGENCYTYACGYDTHVHGDGCRILDCSIPTGHTHSNTCKGSNNTNTVKIVHFKYQENLESIWPVTDGNGKVYNSGQRWTPSGSNTYSQVLVYIANMPGESFTLTLSESSNDTYTMNYYLEVLEGESYDVTYNSKHFRLYTTVKANYNYITEAEDFFDIIGYDQYASDPKFSSGQIDINKGGTVNFYYTRVVDHYLTFQSNGVVVNEHTVHGIPYGASLKKYNFTPNYPSSLEPGAYVFDGWYTSPGHFDGTEVDWDTITMEDGGVLLYAKWTPITHTIEIYFDNTLTQQIGETQTVPHGNFATAPTDTLSNGAYIFQGWFYTVVEDGKTVEKAFVFTGIPVTHDLKIYAKWSSHVTVNYKINYVLFNGGTQIADSTVGSSIAGNNKTFYAKAGEDLYAGYREGYYPLTSSHTITMSPELGEVLEFTFQYVYVESMPYLVRYLDENGAEILAKKVVNNNNYSVVTETFVRVDKMMPDAYQKRLVLSASGTDKDGDGIYDENVITFNYSKNEENAYYKVVYYIENIGGDGYREYRSEDAVGVIGNEYSISLITLTGFSYNPTKTTVNGVYTATSTDKVTATLTSEGLLINLYYDRVEVDYVVKYLESGTEKVLYEEPARQGIYGEQVVVNAVKLTTVGYTLVSDSVKQLTLSANASQNVIKFYYQESTYSIKYQIVGSTDGAELSLKSENIKAVSGIPTGSMPIVSSGYSFVGWYFDESCDHPVPAEWVTSNNEIVPQKEGDVWLNNTTYYAKIEPDFTSLVISSVGCSDVDSGQLFMFRIQGTSELTVGIDITVTVSGNSSVTVTELPIGDYTVTQLTEWSYRYTPDSAVKNITVSVNASKNTVLFSQIRTTTKWLDGNDNKINTYD